MSGFADCGFFFYDSPPTRVFYVDIYPYLITASPLLSIWVDRYIAALKSAMQIIMGGTAIDNREDDQDSLFGSPPSSPVRGRSPSPALALPSASFSTQNVGTIALPGSHHYSELPVTPLALSSGHTLNELTPRPPANSIDTTNCYPPHVHKPSYSSGRSRASSIAPSLNSKKNNTKNSRSRASTLRPPPPGISLPDPSDPPPANFLRNQSTLLGTAGLVGGVKPANLSVHRHIRGADASNPIIVEDEDDAPIIGRTSNFFRPHPYHIDPTLLPTPSTQDVVAMLIAQKDIFPVLANILKLIVAGSGPRSDTNLFRSTSLQKSTSPNPDKMNTSTAPPTKKRKLNRVPAGAVDWDVPYPFPQGEGPDAYRTTWERERSKQLISQLVTLIKSAARKAATRIYLQNEKAKKAALEKQQAAYAEMQATFARAYWPEDEVKVYGHYRPSTATYGMSEAALTDARIQGILTDAGNNNKETTLGSIPSPSLSVQPSTVGTSNCGSYPLEQLVSSLLAATPDQGVVATTSTMAPDSTVDETSNYRNTNVDFAARTNNAENGINQGLFDNWMDILQTFQMSSEGLTQSQGSEQPLPSTSMMSTNDDFGLFGVDSTFDFDLSLPDLNSLTAPTDPILGTPICNDVAMSDGNNTSTSNLFNDVDLLDPTSLTVSLPHPSTVTLENDIDNTPSLAASPIPSMSPFGDPGPATPNSASWDLSMPDILPSIALDLGYGHHREGLGGQGMWGYALWNSIAKTQQVSQGSVDEPLDILRRAHNESSVVGTQKRDKGKRKDTEPLSASNLMQNLSRTDSGPPTSISVLQTNSSIDSGKSLNKDDILRRAMKRKKQLMAEVVKVKTQLWETTIEQGILTHMNHYAHTSEST